MILGSVLLLWLFGLSIALIVVSSKYADLSVVALSSRLDGVERHHSDRWSRMGGDGQGDGGVVVEEMGWRRRWVGGGG